MYLRPKVGIWGLTQCCGGPFKFWSWNGLFWAVSYNAPWLLYGRSEKKIIIQPSVVHKVAKTSSKKVFWILPIFSPKWAEPWFRPFLRPGRKVHVPPIFSKKFIKEFFSPIGKVQHILKLDRLFFLFLRYPVFQCLVLSAPKYQTLKNRISQK